MDLESPMGHGDCVLLLQDDWWHHGVKPELSMTRLRKLRHLRGDVPCTVLLLLLVLLCLLLYTRQLLQLDPHGSTASSRILLGTEKSKVERRSVPKAASSSKPTPPPCKPQSRPAQSRARAQSKPRPRSRSRQKKALPSKMAPTIPAFDFQSYVRGKDHRRFPLLINQPEKCAARGVEGEDAPYLLIAVKSIPQDFDKRQVVRRTWGQERRLQTSEWVRRVFLLGVPPNGSALPLWDQLLSHESRAFGDILLWDFQDTFFNLTLKETHFLEWVNRSCPRVKFVFKGDADVYVNVENILEMLRGQKVDRDLFVGDIIANAKPIRRRNSKYYVPEFMYGAGLYPPYAGGGGFVMSGHTARRLSSACQQVELFPIDDVFLGMCLQVMGVKPLRHQGFRTFGIPRPSEAPHLQTFEPCFYRELMVVHSLSVPQIWLMWNLLQDPGLRCHRRNSQAPGSFRWRTADSRSRAALHPPPVTAVQRRVSLAES
ncbi:UDP-GlcNAc:betaGal beta-1,3-N-acetylglucosaminyltransferase 9 isoform X2 [Synchiropus splendidus]|uniref:UDP-GlcNAc:betaGal beta-1,3-N-acetylglucosaminyltransferase 9 isoform X2 n=1 Tax=Synchiropus splendidus TaxID=270530 RepID=UPI00237E0832|nr:UDP-GlcNAc:betaGal beta-1,3-N-acetylglucosaminyltransferase 9 isoform X2 [Synchiropus splendidus]